MANNLIQIKRTSVSGRAANSTTLQNPGELALNMTDGILYSTNGSVVFEVGANNTNAKVTNTLTVNSISANGNAGSNNQRLTSNGSSAYWKDPLLKDLTDVAANGATDTQVLTYSSTLNKWINQNPPVADVIYTTGYYGVFYDSTPVQWATGGSNTATVTKIENTYLGNGITRTSNDELQIAYSGVYQFQYSIQYTSSSNKNETIWVWLRKNGTDVPDSTTDFGVYPVSGGANGYIVAVTPLVDNAAAGDKYQIMWATSSNSSVSIVSPQATTFSPATPGVIVSVIPITNIITAPPGTNTSVVFNDSGVSNALSGFTFTKTTNSVSVANNVYVGNTVNAGAFAVDSTFWANSTVVNSTSFQVGSSFTANATLVNAAALLVRGDTTVNGIISAAGGANGIQLTNATSNWIGWNSAGVGAPTRSTTSAGTKMVLWPNITPSTVDYAIGIESNHMWFSSPDSSVTGFKWYSNTTNFLTANVAGVFASGKVNASSFTTGANVTIDTAKASFGNGTSTNAPQVVVANTTGTTTINAGSISTTSITGNLTGNVAATTITGNLTGNVAATTISGNLTGNVVATNVNTATLQVNTSISIDSNKSLRFQTVNSAAYTTLIQQNDDNFVFYSTNTTGGQRAVFNVYANTNSPNQNSAFRLNVPLDIANFPIFANGSQGTTGQLLTSNGSATYWSSPGAVSINTAATYTWTNNHTFNANVTMTYAYFANNNGQVNPSAGDFKANAYATLSGAGGNYLAFGQQTNYAQWIQSGYSAVGSTTYYPIILNPLGGNIGIGNTNPSYKLRVEGDISLSGGISVNNSFGTTGQVLTSNGTGAYWADAAAGVNVAAQYAWTNTHSFAANVSITANALGLTSNSSAIYLNGTADPNWKIGRNTGATPKWYYSNNTLDFIAASSNLEGVVFGFTGNSYLETGYAGTFVKDKLVVGNSSVNVFSNATSFVGNTIGAHTGNVSGNVVATTISGNLTGNVAATTISGNLTGNVVATTVSASANITVGSNVLITTANLSIGNATANVFANSTAFVGNVVATSLTGNLSGNVAATTISGNLTGNVAAVTISGNLTGNVVATTVNATSINATANIVVGANLLINTSVLSIGNATANVFVNSTAFVGNVVATAITGNLTGNVAATTITGNLTGNVAATTISGNLTAVTANVINKIQVGTPGAFDFGSNAVIEIDANGNTYVQLVVQNANTGNNASADLVVTADSGNDSTDFVDLGINNSLYNQAGFNIIGAKDAYLYASNGNLAIGTASAKDVIFHAGGTTINDRRMTINTSAVSIGNTSTNVVINNTSFVGNVVASTVTGNLTGNVVATTVSSSSNIAVGANVLITTANLAIGNATANVFVNSTAFVGNTTGTHVGNVVGNVTATTITGNLTGNVAATTISGNLTGNVAATTISGNLTGNVVGNVTATTLTGNLTGNVTSTVISASANVTVGANVLVNTSAFNIAGNTTTAPTLTLVGSGLTIGNTTITGSPQVIVANTSGTTTINTNYVSTTTIAGNLTGNVVATTVSATSNVTVGSNVIVNTSSLSIGNTTVNAVVNSSYLSVGSITTNSSSLVVNTSANVVVGNSRITDLMLTSTFFLMGA